MWIVREGRFSSVVNDSFGLNLSFAEHPFMVFVLYVTLMQCVRAWVVMNLVFHYCFRLATFWLMGCNAHLVFICCNGFGNSLMLPILD